MFYLNRDIELDAVLLHKMISRYNLNVAPRLRKYKNYYDGLHQIMSKNYNDPNKPCSRTVTNYCRNIVDSYSGYLATPGFISYKSEQDIEDIMDILRYNDYQSEDNDLLMNALVYGIGCELMYIDALGHTRFSLIDPAQCFPVYEDTLAGDLLYFVRIYPLNEWDDSNIYKVDVYSDSFVKHYTMRGLNGSLSFEDEEPHYFAQVPANVFLMPDEKSIFDCVLGLQDAANELLSSEIDDYSAFCDAYLALTGVDANPEDIAAMKKNRVLVLPEGASAQWITKNMNDAQVENILKRIHDSIYRISQCVDFSSDNFNSGVSSGVAIQYKLTGMENKAGTIEGRMKKALQRRIEIICGIASLKLGEEVFRDIEITFKRNIPEDTAATINLINSLKGSVSDATLLAQVPFITDVNAELEALNKQKQENMSLYSYGFTTGTDEEDDLNE